MQGKVEIAGVNTAKLKVLKNDETILLSVSFVHAGRQRSCREKSRSRGSTPPS